MNRQAVARFAAYALVVVVGAAGLWRVESTAHKAQAAAVDAQQALDELQADRAAARIAGCEQDDKTNALVRRMSRDAPLEVGEAIIEVSTAQDDGTPPDPAVIDQFRAAMARRLEGIVNQLPAREWDPDLGRCVDVPLDTGG